MYLTIFFLFTLLVAFGAEFALRNLSESNYDPTVPWVGLIFIVATLSVAGYEYCCFQLQGGKYLAEFLGAELVDAKTTNPKKIQLLNIVNEMAIAASLPVPPVYILEANEINAFAAGLGEKNAIITVTRGCLNELTRDELQGVIAHEMGHIYNGDMKISIRLAAMVMGFYFVFVMALKLLQYGPVNQDDERRTPNVYMIALVLLAAGFITYIFGSILKATVSRQREYLADACAVQFTRNPNGIANALRKIAKTPKKNDMPKEGLAFSHLYFNENVSFSSLFATHPPIEKRIALIEGLDYLPPEWKKELERSRVI